MWLIPNIKSSILLIALLKLDNPIMSFILIIICCAVVQSQRICFIVSRFPQISQSSVSFNPHFFRFSFDGRMLWITLKWNASIELSEQQYFAKVKLFLWLISVTVFIYMIWDNTLRPDPIIRRSWIIIYSF